VLQANTVGVLMKYIKTSVLYIGLLSVFNVATIKPILPETIATATLLKYGGLASLAAIGGRYLGFEMKKVATKFQLDFNTYPNFEYFDDSQLKNEQRVTNQQQAYLQVSFLQKIKDAMFMPKEQEIPGSRFSSRSAETTHDSKNYNWSQTNIHAQQARGLFSRVNNYHYYSDKGDFWKGATVGSFVTGTTSMYLVLKLKKD